MARDYLKEKADKKKSGLRALWALLIIIIIAVSIFVRAMIGGDITSGLFKGLPGSDRAYSVAKEFITPTLKSNSVDFSDTHYQFGKTSDSVYVIKSSVISKDKNDEKVTTEFKIILKYNGGDASQQKNWTLITLDEF